MVSLLHIKDVFPISFLAYYESDPEDDNLEDLRPDPEPEPEVVEPLRLPPGQ